MLTHQVHEDDVPPGTAKFFTDVVACATGARDTHQVEWQLNRRLEGRNATHLRYRIRR